MSNKVPKLRFKGFDEEWEITKLGDLLDYEQPTKYIVNSTEYSDEYAIPVLTAGQSFILGYTNEKNGIKEASKENPVIIFDDFTTGSHFVDFEFKVKSSAMKLLTTKSEANDFYFTYYKLKNLNFVPQSHERHWISKFSNFEVNITKPDEQEKIGNLFKAIDTLISLRERRLDLLKEQKRGFLQKLFPKAGEVVPELRFDGFTDDWENRKLEEIAKRVTRKNKSLESTLPLTISAQDGLIDQNNFFNKTVASRDVTGYYLVKNGEFAYNKSYSNGYPWGAIKRLNRYDMGVLSTLYIVFKPFDIDSNFLEKYYDTTYWHKEVSKHAAEGARNHGLLNIAATDFFKTNLVIPINKREQQKIGNFLKQLDDSIILNQLDLDYIKEQKKGFLQNMFI